MVAILEDIEIRRIDLVDRGANPGAKILLWKRDFHTETGGSFVEQDKTGGAGASGQVTEPSADNTAELTKQLDTLTEENTSLKAVVAELNEKLAKSEAQTKPEPADIWKSVPAELRKQFDELAAKAAAAEELAKRERNARMEREYLAKAATLEMLPMETSKLGATLRKLDEALGEDAAGLYGMLEAANEQLKQSSLLKTMGSGRKPPEGTDFPTRVEQLAKAEGLTYGDAAIRLAKAEPDSYFAYQTAAMKGVA